MIRTHIFGLWTLEIYWDTLYQPEECTVLRAFDNLGREYLGTYWCLSWIGWTLDDDRDPGELITAVQVYLASVLLTELVEVPKLQYAIARPYGRQNNS